MLDGVEGAEPRHPALGEPLLVEEALEIGALRLRGALGRARRKA